MAAFISQPFLFSTNEPCFFAIPKQSDEIGEHRTSWLVDISWMDDFRFNLIEEKQNDQNPWIQITTAATCFQRAEKNKYVDQTANEIHQAMSK